MFLTARSLRELFHRYAAEPNMKRPNKCKNSELAYFPTRPTNVVKILAQKKNETLAAASAKDMHQLVIIVSGNDRHKKGP